MGFIDVIYRSNGTLLEAHMVYENDEFDYEQGSAPKVTHKPLVFGERGDLIGCYAIARMPQGNFSIEFLTVEDIEQCRKVSKNPNGVWKMWFAEMAKKSAIRRLYKRLPKSADNAMISAYDEKVEIGADTSEFYDIEGVEIPEEQTNLSEIVD
jgi:recombination protein RecT